MENYIITDDLDKATHWRAKKDLGFEDDFYKHAAITVGEIYPVTYYKIDDEYCIIDENGHLSMIWLCHNGEFLIIEE